LKTGLKTGMKIMKKSSIMLFIVPALLSIGTGCPLVTGKAEVPVVIPVQTLQGSPVLGLFKLNDFKLPLLPAGHATAPAYASTLLLTDIEIRTINPKDPNDSTNSALLKPSRMGECLDGQPDLGFIDELTITIRHKGEADSAAVRLAHYKKTEANPCSIQLVTDQGVELLQYVSDYQIDGTFTGHGNSQSLSIGGFSKIFTDGEFPSSGDSAQSSTSSNAGDAGTGTTPAPSTPDPTKPPIGI
jgi:hypothetical protein